MPKHAPAPFVPAQAGLAPGDCRITLTRDEREMLHLLLAIARERPSALIDDAEHTHAGRIMCAHAARIQGKLPRRGSGTYG